MIEAADFKPSEIQFDIRSKLELVAAAGDDDLMTFAITAYNGGSLSLPNFEHPAYIELSSVRTHGDGTQQPILKDHDTRTIVGHGRPVVGEKNLRVEEGVISHDNDASREIVRAARKGFQWQASVGGKMTKPPIMIEDGRRRFVNGRSVSGPAVVIRGFLWRETTMCGIGCDDERATARLAASEGALDMKFSQWAADKGFDVEAMEKAQVDSLKAMFDDEQKRAAEVKAAAESAAAEDAAAKAAEKAAKEGAETAAAAAAATTVTAAVTTPKAPRVDPEVQAAADLQAYRDKMRAGRIAEAKRVEELESLRDEYEPVVRKTVLAALFNQAMDGDLDRNKFELELVKEARKPRQPLGLNAGQQSSGPYRPRDYSPAVVEAALLQTGGMAEDGVAAAVRREHGESKVEQIMNDASNHDMQGFGLHDLIFACIESAGEQIPSRRINHEVISCAMQCSLNIHASNGASTVSLPGTLSNIANKQMLQSYEDNQGIWPIVASTASSSDFKQFDSHRMTEAGVLEPVGPNGEIKHTTLSEDTFANRIVNYARMLGLSEEMLTNDDLGAFQKLSRHFGRMSAHAIEQAVIQTITLAPVGAAATDFFRSAALGNMQPNYFSGASSALDTTSLGTAWKLFAEQTDREGKPVMLEPAVLLTTTANVQTARVLYNSSEVRLAGVAERTRGVHNEWKGQFLPKHSAYLHQAAFNGGSVQTTQWYLVCKVTDDFAPVQVAFLNGQKTPQIERFDYDPNMLGIQFRAKLPFGVALQDPRCIVKSKGAA